MSGEKKGETKIETLDQAKARIALLEQKLDEAINLLIRRDEQLDKAERRILDLEERLDAKG